MWVRGLKQRWIYNPALRQVAPHVGAWIETKSNRRQIRKRPVAPHVGAWIETFCEIENTVRVVAPHVGAWIETPTSCADSALSLSHPMWVRGLKLKMRKQLRKIKSHPMWVRGLKHKELAQVIRLHGRTPCGCVD